MILRFTSAEASGVRDVPDHARVTDNFASTSPDNSEERKGSKRRFAIPSPPLRAAAHVEVVRSAIR